MPVVSTYVTGWGSSGAGSATVSSAGQSMSKNILYTVTTLVRNGTSANLSNATISSPNLTWTRRGTPQNVGTSSPTRRIEKWTAMPTTNLTGEVISMAIANGLSQTEYGAELFVSSGVDPSGPVSSNVIQGDSGTTSGTTFTIPATFATFGSLDNGAISVFGSTGGTTSTTMSPRVGWTELREFGDANDHHQIQFIPVPDTTASVDNTSSGLHAGIAIELNAAPNPVFSSASAIGSITGGTQGTSGFTFSVTLRTGRVLFVVMEADPTANGITDYTLTVPGVTVSQLFNFHTGHIVLIWRLTTNSLVDVTTNLNFFATGGTVSGATNQTFLVDLVEAQNVDLLAGTQGIIQQVSATAGGAAALTITPAAFAHNYNTALVLGGGNNTGLTSTVPSGWVTDLANTVSSRAILVTHRNSEPQNFAVTAGGGAGHACVFFELAGAPPVTVPTATLISPALGTIAAATAIVIDLLDTGGDLSTVEIKANGVTVRTGTSTGAYSTGYTATSTNNAVTNGRRYSFLPDTGFWPGGALAIVVVAVDARASTSTTSFAFTSSLGSAPTVTRVSPALGSIGTTVAIVLDLLDVDGNISTAVVTANGTTAFTGTLSSGSFSAGFTVNSTKSVVTNGYRLSIRPDSGGWTPGALTVAATPVDTLGNTGTGSFTWTVSAGSAPVVTRNSPALGSIATTATIDVSVTDADVDLSTVVITANGITVRTGTAAGAFSAGFTSLSTNGALGTGRQYAFRPDAGSWSTGALTVNVTGVDALGNSTTTSFTWTVSAGVAPVVTRNSPALGTILATDALDISVTDADTDLSTVAITVNGVTVHTGAAAGVFSTGFTSLSTNTGITGGRRYAFRPDAGSWSPGALTAVVVAVDALGNSTTASFTWTVAAPVANPPTITLVSPADGSTILRTDSIVVDVTDVDNDVTGFTAVFNSALAWLAGSTTPVSAFSISSRVALSGAGNYRYTLRLTAGWPDGTLTFNGAVSDSAGGLVSAVFSWSVVSPATSAVEVDAEATPVTRARDIEIDPETNDIVLTPTGDLSIIGGGVSVAQAIRQVLRTFLGEWFLDESVGVPWYDQILVKAPNLPAVRAVIRDVILAVPGVLDVTTISVDLNRVTRALLVTFTATSDVGELVETIEVSR